MTAYGILGDPIEHSLSPVIYQTAFDELGMSDTFERFHVTEGDVTDAVRGGKALGMGGLSVTMPHKETVAGLESITLTGTADAVGSVNTVDTSNMRGYNTDGYGAVRALKVHDVRIKGTDVTILGAGGAGRSIAYEFGTCGARLDIANIEPERAVDIARIIERDGGTASGHPLDDVEPLIADSDILINATSVGMNTDESLVSRDQLHEDLVVFDAVYEPLQTKLLEHASDVGAKTIDGAWMLLYQGVEAFKIWTGQRPPVDTMNDALRTALSDAPHE